LRNYTIYSCGLITRLAELQVGKYINYIYNDEIKKKKTSNDFGSLHVCLMAFKNFFEGKLDQWFWVFILDGLHEFKMWRVGLLTCCSSYL